jgi:spermidine/putrescine transport system substrate-binding protein
MRIAPRQRNAEGGVPYNRYQTSPLNPNDLRKGEPNMKKLIVLILTLALLLPILSACADDDEPTQGVVRVFNWGEYIDPTVLEDFEREYGIRVIYSVFSSNEEMYAAIRMGGETFDVLIPSDYMIARMIEENMLAELNFDNIPNFALVDPRFKYLEFDPENRFSVPYMTGTVGIIYNSAMVGHEVTSWASLFNESYAGMILMFDNPRDAFGIALKYLGYYINTTNEAEINEAFDLLLRQRAILQAYVMDQIFDKLESGEAIMGPYYSGDYFTMRANNPDLRFARPVEGTNFFVDSMVVPIDSENRENAEKFINFMASTEIALRNMYFIRYASANLEAVERFAREQNLSAEDYAIMFASQEVLNNAEVFTHLPQHILDLYDELWVRLRS